MKYLLIILISLSALACSGPEYHEVIRELDLDGVIVTERRAPALGHKYNVSSLYIEQKLDEKGISFRKTAYGEYKLRGGTYLYVRTDGLNLRIKAYPEQMDSELKRNIQDQGRTETIIRFVRILSDLMGMDDPDFEIIASAEEGWVFHFPSTPPNKFRAALEALRRTNSLTIIHDAYEVDDEDLVSSYGVLNRVGGEDTITRFALLENGKYGSSLIFAE